MNIRRVVRWIKKHVKVSINSDLLFSESLKENEERIKKLNDSNRRQHR